MICAGKFIELGSGIKVDIDYLRALLTNEIVKRDLIDSEEAEAAFQNVKHLQKAAHKKSSEKVLEEKPILAPVEDTSGYVPPAAVGTSEKYIDNRLVAQMNKSVDVVKPT